MPETTEGPGNLSVQRWPDMKQKTLCLTEGNETTVLARFLSDSHATMFVQAINERLAWAYDMGRKGVTG